MTVELIPDRDPTIFYEPPLDATRQRVELPIDTVTLLEDRAQVHRTTTLHLSPGAHRLVVLDVAPTLQDVSVRAECDEAWARVPDTGARRAQRVALSALPEDVQTIERELRALQDELSALRERRERLRHRFATVGTMLTQGAAEVPQDVAWGVADPEGWAATFGDLFSRARGLQDEDLDAATRQREIVEAIGRLTARREAIARPDQRLSAWIELDIIVAPHPPEAQSDEIDADAARPVTVHLYYTVPNALWRPAHRARLRTAEGALTIESEAVVWQHTGEDWRDVQLIFSTARSSLGTDPPLLADDLLHVQRKDEQLRVAAREVEIQAASVGGGGGGSAPTSQSVELPGVDDGGDIQTLRARRRVTIPSDGHPAFVALFDFTAPARLEHVAMPEASPHAFLKVTTTNGAAHPLLAGPVELARDGGVVGTTELLFVAPGERFELGFGPQDELRITRSHTAVRDTTDPDDRWRHRRTAVMLFLSNLSNETRALTLTERVPVSEIPQVRIRLIHESNTGDPLVDLYTTDGDPKLDEHGMVTWQVELPPHGRLSRTLVFEFSTAPDVQGL